MNVALSDKLLEIRGKFVSSLPERKERLTALHEKLTAGTCTASDMDELRFIVHKIHGLAGTLGFATLGSFAANLEKEVNTAIEKGGYSSTLCDGVTTLSGHVQDAIDA
ncbi:Hpt domain-containing protein [Neptunicoccus sediminis]|uniref:Hpt domain-containing protein n=1 Tax=Neptunicoccus sediminis TaxID=1892596 RepID=UPI000845CE39|nr:Hpt domain-containing protein [Neptunicoccus sediminis]